MAQTPAASLAATAAAAFASEPVAEAVSSEPDLARDFVLYETGWDYPDSLPPTSTHLQQLVNRGFYHQGAATAELMSMLSTLLGNWSWTADIAEQSITFAGQGNLLRTKFYALGSQSNISNTWRWVAQAEAGGLLDTLAREAELKSVPELQTIATPENDVAINIALSGAHLMMASAELLRAVGHETLTGLPLAINGGAGCMYALIDISSFETSPGAQQTSGDMDPDERSWSTCGESDLPFPRQISEALFRGIVQVNDKFTVTDATEGVKTALSRRNIGDFQEEKLSETLLRLTVAGSASRDSVVNFLAEMHVDDQGSIRLQKLGSNPSPSAVAVASTDVDALGA